MRYSIILTIACYMAYIAAAASQKSYTFSILNTDYNVIDPELIDGYLKTERIRKGVYGMSGLVEPKVEFGDDFYVSIILILYRNLY